MYTRCARCGEPIEPVHPRDAEGSDIWRSYCDKCNDDFNRSMAEQSPHGQCGRCGARYDAYALPCPKCSGVGEVLVRPIEPEGPQWAICPRCGGAEEVVEVIASHEETLCGFPHGDGREYGTLTHVEVLAHAREQQAWEESRREDREQWRRAMESWVAGGRRGPEPDVDDIPF